MYVLFDKETDIDVNDIGIIFKTGEGKICINPSDKQMIALVDKINAYLQDKELTKK